MNITSHAGGVAAMLAAELPAAAVGVAWLGQAGFVVRAGGCRLVIDPYLSDTLAVKYRGTERSHVRLMPAPVRVEELREVDWVLCSHRHSDHMDPGTLPVIATANPRCRFIVPRAEAEAALLAGIPAGQTTGLDAGESLQLTDQLILSGLASAHEEFQTNARGEHHFLGFILKTPQIGLYHSGDCVPIAGRAEELAALGLDAALLPVNGRGRGVAGNLDFDEAHALCRQAKIPVLVPHHFGMFAFNTVEVAELERAIDAAGSEVRCLVPRVDAYWVWQQERGGKSR